MLQCSSGKRCGLAMANWMVSPRFDMQSLRVGRASPVDVFEDAIRGWILDYAARLAGLDKPNSGMAVMVLLSAYPETIESYLTGRDSRDASKKFFRDGMKRIYPELADVPGPKLDSVCDDLRNGLYHGSMLKGTVVLEPEGAAIVYSAEEDAFRINPFAFLARVQEHFVSYIGRLRASEPGDVELSNFTRFWQVRHGRALQTGHGEAAMARPEEEIVLSTAAPIDPARVTRML